MKVFFSCLIVLAFSVSISADQIANSKQLVAYSEMVDPSKTVYSQSYWTKIEALKLEIARLEGASPLPESFVQNQADFYLQQLEEE